MLELAGVNDRLPVTGFVQRGHRVASGQCADPRFPGGTIEMQKPLFRELGCNLDAYHPGTINLCIAPFRFRVRQARYRFRNLRWTTNAPAEDFSFVDCRILTGSGAGQEGLVYYPHPETKPEHFQTPGTIEIITGYIEGLDYGDALSIELDSRQVEIYRADDGPPDPRTES